MKIPLVVALVGLAMSFALPTLAQPKDTVALDSKKRLFLARLELLF